MENKSYHFVLPDQKEKYINATSIPEMQQWKLNSIWPASCFIRFFFYYFFVSAFVTKNISLAVFFSKHWKVYCHFLEETLEANG